MSGLFFLKGKLAGVLDTGLAIKIIVVIIIIMSLVTGLFFLVILLNQ